MCKADIELDEIYSYSNTHNLLSESVLNRVRAGEFCVRVCNADEIDFYFLSVIF